METQADNVDLFPILAPACHGSVFFFPKAGFTRDCVVNNSHRYGKGFDVDSTTTTLQFFLLNAGLKLQQTPPASEGDNTAQAGHPQFLWSPLSQGCF